MINDDWKDNMMSIRMPPVKPLKGKGDKGRQADEEVDLNTNSLFSFLQTVKFTVLSIHRFFMQNCIITYFINSSFMYWGIYTKTLAHHSGCGYVRTWDYLKDRQLKASTFSSLGVLMMGKLLLTFYAANIPTENPFKETAADLRWWSLFNRFFWYLQLAFAKIIRCH